MTIDMKTVKGVTLNGQTVKYIHDLNNNQLWPYSSPIFDGQFYIKNESNNINTIELRQMTGVYGSAPTINLSISSDNINWINIGTSSFTIQPNKIMFIKSLSSIPWCQISGGGSPATYGECWNYFYTSDNFSIHGDIMKLLNYNNLQRLDCYGMFYNCNKLKLIDITMPSNTSELCYAHMFYGCTSITSLPSGLLPATNLSSSCYDSMFYGCTSLLTLPSGLLPATTMKSYCYQFMFHSCTSLRSIPNNFLPAMTLANRCYESMFDNCQSLRNVPATLLPATTLATNCYETMFASCLSLVNAPTLPSITGASQCYVQMFNGCSNLNYVKCLLQYGGGTMTSDWLDGVKATGTFVKNVSATDWRSGSSGIPNGWTVQTVNP